jgi:hypothetical protein
MPSCLPASMSAVSSAWSAGSPGHASAGGPRRPLRSLCWSLVLGCLWSCGSGGLYTDAQGQVVNEPLTYDGTPVVTTDPVVAGQPMTLSFTVENNTYLSLFNVPWQIYLGDDPTQIIASGTISQITPSGETGEDAQFTAPAAGSYTLTVVVDPDDTLDLGESGGAAATTSVVTVTPAPG